MKSGKVITNSNIIDLLKEAIVGTRIKERRIPDGWKQFIDEIVDSDMSKDIFTKKTTRDDIKNEIKSRKEKHFPEEWENFYHGLENCFVVTQVNLFVLKQDLQVLVVKEK